MVKVMKIRIWGIWAENLEILQNYDERGFQKSSDDKNSPEMDVSERDLTPVKISASNSKNSRSYRIFAKKSLFFVLQ